MSRKLSNLAIALALVGLSSCAAPAAPTPAPGTTSAPSPVETSAVPTPTPAEPGLSNWFDQLPIDARGCPVPDAEEEYQPAEPSVIGADSLPAELCLYDSMIYDVFVILPVQPSLDFPQQVTDWLVPEGWEFGGPDPDYTDLHYQWIADWPEDVEGLYEMDSSIDGAIVMSESITQAGLDRSMLALGVSADTFGYPEEGDPVFWPPSGGDCPRAGDVAAQTGRNRALEPNGPS